MKWWKIQYKQKRQQTRGRIFCCSPILNCLKLFKPTEMCFLSNNVYDYYNVSQGKITVPGIDDGEESMLADVSHRIEQFLCWVTRHLVSRSAISVNCQKNFDSIFFETSNFLLLFVELSLFDIVTMFYKTLWVYDTK